MSAARGPRGHVAGRTVLATALSAMALAGCALATATPPTAGLLDARLVGLGLTEQQVAATLCVTNPNDTPLSFGRVTVGVDVAGLPAGEGVSDAAVVLPPRASTVVPFTVVTTIRNAGPQLLGILQQGGVEYRIRGTVTLQGALGITLPFSRSGRLDPLTGTLDLARAAADPAAGRCG